MSETTKAQPAFCDVAELRAKLFDDLAPFQTFAKAVGKSERAVGRWAKNGLPIRYIGKRPYVVVSQAMEFLARPKATPAPVRRGRPRKTASN